MHEQFGVRTKLKLKTSTMFKATEKTKLKSYRLKLQNTFAISRHNTTLKILS